MSSTFKISCPRQKYLWNTNIRPILLIFKDKNKANWNPKKFYRSSSTWHKQNKTKSDKTNPTSNLLNWEQEAMQHLGKCRHYNPYRRRWCSLNYGHQNYIKKANPQVYNKIYTYSPSYNVTAPFSRVLIGQHLIFCSLTSPTCCNSPRKCTPVKHKRQKAGFPIVT